MNILGAQNSFFNTAFNTIKTELRYAFKSLLDPDTTRDSFFRKEMMRSTAELLAQPHIQQHNY